ncbi:MAG: bifunctional diaminohydroxyphosphoribosylaminopyrimidine deaminase/5-amino-6-(5-phosphoribosylamino)uracil reductase RibD [Acidobacteriaceae bacterium]
MSGAGGQQAERQRVENARWMRRALELARESKAMSSPNPAVGCVLVRGGVVVGEGFHDYARRDHAEVAALKQAGDAARGSTAYVTLEPCCHTGRTGPCTEALIAAGVARVVAATGDPNREVNGRGFARLRGAGIAVETGEGAEEARELNDAFAGFIRRGRPFVTLKAGVSLDGRIGPREGVKRKREPYFLTGPESLADVQRMRHEHDVLMTGINTVLTDDPQLTDRTGLARRRPLLRVVLDSELRLPLDSKLVREVNEDVMVFCTEPTAASMAALEARGVRVEVVQSDVPGRVPMGDVLRRLAEMKMISVMIEAGGQVTASALQDGLVDKIVLYYAPVMLGSGGLPLMEKLAMERLDVSRVATAQFGRDVRWTGYLHDPWSEAGVR